MTLRKTDTNPLSEMLSLSLFEGIAAQDAEQLIDALGAKITTYNQGEIIVQSHERVNRLVIVLSGSAQVATEDPSGRKTLFKVFGAGDVTWVSSDRYPGNTSPYLVTALEETRVITIESNALLSPRYTLQTDIVNAHFRLLGNLLGQLIDGHYTLFKHLNILSKRTTQDKLMAYLSYQARACGSMSFDIPLSRQELADYLCVDRSAMCTELYKLRAAGKLEVKGRHFDMAELTETL